MRASPPAVSRCGTGSLPRSRYVTIPSGWSQQALTSMLEMDATNVVGLLNELEAENLVERRRSPQDRRRHVVEITDVGVKQLTKAELALAAVENEVFGALNVDQRQTLYNMLQQVVGGDELRCPEAI